MNYIRTVPRWFPESFMVISSVGSEIWARVHTSGSSNTQYQVHGEKYISRTRFFPDMRFSQDDSRHFVLSISAIKSAYSMVRFSAKCQKPHFLAHICNFWMIQNFWPKKGSVTFFLLSISNFMQNKLLLNGPPIAYKKDTFSIKYLSKFATATCHKAQQVSTSKRFFADIIKKVSRSTQINEVSWWSFMVIFRHMTEL